MSLLVRLCSITKPSMLRLALADPRVTVRYYTDRQFHAKLYIIDDVALVGSANLTEAGLTTNREVSVMLKKGRDDGFDDLLPMFSTFWSYADTLTSDVCAQYEAAFKVIGGPQEEANFQKHLEKFVPRVDVPSAKVGSDKVSKERAFIRAYRRKYDEQLIPAFREVEAIFAAFGQRRPEFADSDPIIELGRFLGWTRLVKAPGDILLCPMGTQYAGSETDDIVTIRENRYVVAEVIGQIVQQNREYCVRGGGALHQTVRGHFIIRAVNHYRMLIEHASPTADEPMCPIVERPTDQRFWQEVKIVDSVEVDTGKCFADISHNDCLPR